MRSTSIYARVRMGIVTIALIAVLVYSLLPSRFSPTHEFVRRRDMVSHLELSTGPAEFSNESCRLDVGAAPRQLLQHPRAGPIELMDWSRSAEDMALSLGISPGGSWRPSECEAVIDVAVIVPYRGRAQQLATFLAYMHPFLQSQNLDYQIIVVEQSERGDFNRGKLFNVGYAEAQGLARRNFSCYVFHDVDLLPQNRDNVYACGRDHPRHMSSAVNTFRYTLPWTDSFGGVVAFTSRQFRACNGFANVYEGWGGEDNDMHYRLKNQGYKVLRFEPDISMYYMLTHKKEVPSPRRFELLAGVTQRFTTDGLNNLEYEVLSRQARPLFLRLRVAL